MASSLRASAVMLLIVLALIWGTSFILIKQGLKVFSPDEVGALRVSSAAVFLLPAAFVRLRELTKEHYLKLFLSGMAGIFIPAFLFANAQTNMDSSVAGIMNTLTPIFTLIIGAFIFNQKFKNTAIIGILLGFLGAVILMFARAGGQLGSLNFYALLIVIACIFYAINVNLIKYKITDLKALTITSGSLLMIGPFALIYLFGFTDFVHKVQHETGGWQAAGFIVLLGCASTAIATVLFNKLVKISTPIFASSVTYIMPIVAVGWGLVDGETLGFGHLFGMIAITAGVYLANRK